MSAPPLDDVCGDLVRAVGPDMDAVARFRTRDGQKCEPIIVRLNELLALMEDVAAAEQFGDPRAAAERLRAVFASVDAALAAVQRVRGRLQLLDRHVRSSRPGAVLGFLRKTLSLDSSSAIDLERDVLFDASQLLSECSENGKN